MSIEKNIRTQARAKLKQNSFSKAVFGFAFVMIMYMLFSNLAMLLQVLLSITVSVFDNNVFVNVMSILFYLLILGMVVALSPVVIGYIRMFLTDKDEYNLADVFYYFTSPQLYIKSMLLSLNFLLRIICVFVLLMIPSIILETFSKSFIAISSNSIYKVTHNSLVICAFIALFAFCFRYFLIIPLFFADESKGINNYFRTSIAMMSGNYDKVFKLFGSFCGWIVLCFTVLPILYVLPYIIQAFCISGKSIIDISRNGQNYEVF